VDVGAVIVYCTNGRRHRYGGYTNGRRRRYDGVYLGGGYTPAESELWEHIYSSNPTFMKRGRRGDRNTRIEITSRHVSRADVWVGSRGIR